MIRTSILPAERLNRGLAAGTWTVDALQERMPLSRAMPALCLRLLRCEWSSLARSRKPIAPDGTRHKVAVEIGNAHQSVVERSQDVHIPGAGLLLALEGLFLASTTLLFRRRTSCLGPSSWQQSRDAGLTCGHLYEFSVREPAVRDDV
jgi:hypothetical protein